MVLFPLLLLLFAWGAHDNMTALESLAGGALCGAVLAHFGLKLTRFEVVDGKLFYQPNVYIGMGLMMVFVMRMVYRFSTMPIVPSTQPGTGGAPPMQGLGTSPLTMFIIGLVFCYYAPYSAGVLLRRAKLGKPEAAENRVV